MIKVSQVVNRLSILLITISISIDIVNARISLHNINDFDINGNQCQAQAQVMDCPLVCVEQVSQCPDSYAPDSCPTGQTYCVDGVCRDNCDGAVPRCSCPNNAYENLAANPSATLFPCKQFTAPVFDFEDTSPTGKLALNVACAKQAGIGLIKNESGQAYLLQCTPAEPRQLSSSAPEFIFFYIFLISEGLILLFHSIYKRYMERNYSAIKPMKKKFFHVKADNNEVEMDDLFEQQESEAQLNFIGYKKDVFGTLASSSLIVSSLIWVANLIILTLDYYGVFAKQPNEPFMIFIDHNTLSGIFITVWHLVTLWFVCIKLGQNRQKTYFSLRCTLQNATMVQIEKQLQAPVYLAGMGFLVDRIRHLEKVFRRATRTDVSVHVLDVQKTPSGQKYVEFECVRYLFDERTNTFEETSYTPGPSYIDIHDKLNGLTNSEAHLRMDAVGPNAIAFPADTFLSASLTEFSGFFYIYQMMALWIWFYYSYYYMGLVLSLVIIISGLIKVSVGLLAQRRVLKMAAFHSRTNILRDGSWVSLDSSQIVPGDIIEIESNSDHVLPVDVVLVKGGAVADESSLTGEALPVAKFPVQRENAHFSRETCKVHMLYAGCKIYETQPQQPNEPVYALATDTGASTSKGKLVRDILYPTPISFVFIEHLKLVFAILMLWGIFMLVMCIIMLGTENIDSWFYGMFTISQVLSPLLPAVLVIGQSVASERLRKRRILCVDLQRVTLGGKAKIFAFDKTGTLTKEGLDFRGVLVGNRSSGFGSVLNQFDTFPYEVQTAMQVSHSLQMVREQFVGNFVDIEMFRVTGAKLSNVEGGSGNQIQPASSGASPLNIVKRFEFVHHHAYMSVAVENRNRGSINVYLKGSFEKIKGLVDSNSIPSDYDRQAQYHASQGCYVLALAQKTFDSSVTADQVSSMSRSEIESGAHFIGFMLFRNEIKPDTKSALNELKEGGCRIVMITGDNANCGIYIAKQSGMITEDDPRSGEAVVLLADVVDKQKVEWRNVAEPDHVVSWSDLDDYLLQSKNGGRNVELAVTGKAFNVLVADGTMRKYLLDTRIFARMSPTDKANCVRLHMEKFITAFCGDGGNDSGALKASHCGIALSEAESSVVSHFSSADRSIQSCVTLLRECRCSLDVSFASYKYLLMYGEILAFVGLIQYYFVVNMSQATWILIDGSTIPLSWALTMGKPAKKLAPTRPTSRLLGIETMVSVTGQVIISILFMIFAVVLLFSQDWFLCNEFNGDKADMRRWWELSDNYESATTGLIAIFQIFYAAATYNIGNRYRKGFFRNASFILMFSGLFALLSYMLLADPNSVGCLFRINCGTPEALESLNYAVPLLAPNRYHSATGHNVFPQSFRYKLWGLGLVNFMIVLFFQGVVVLGPVRTWLRRKYPLKQVEFKK